MLKIELYSFTTKDVEAFALTVTKLKTHIQTISAILYPVTVEDKLLTLVDSRTNQQSGFYLAKLI